jgi:hypothetical protein
VSNTEILTRKVSFWAPVLFRAGLWGIVELLRELLSSFLEWRTQVAKGLPITELDIWIALVKAWLAVFLAWRIFLDQTYSRHVASRGTGAPSLSPSNDTTTHDTEVDFAKSQLEKPPIK